MHVLFRNAPWSKKTVKPHQDTKSCSNDELAAIWLEGKVIHTAKGNNGEIIIQLID